MSSSRFAETTVKLLGLVAVTLALASFDLAAGVRRSAPWGHVLGDSAIVLLVISWVFVVGRRPFTAALHVLIQVGLLVLYAAELQDLLEGLGAPRTLSLVTDVGTPVGVAAVSIGFMLRLRAWRSAVAELEASQATLRTVAIMDALTGLYNSRHFYDVLETETSRAQRYGRELSVAFLDIDDFKSFNDAYGHLEGDRLLREIGRVIRRECRENDAAFRYGGEEFTIVFPETDLAHAAVVAERVRTRIGESRLVPGDGAARTVSIGLASLGPPITSVKELVQAADRAMYRAKLDGKNRIACA